MHACFKELLCHVHACQARTLASGCVTSALYSRVRICSFSLCLAAAVTQSLSCPSSSSRRDSRAEVSSDGCFEDGALGAPEVRCLGGSRMRGVCCRGVCTLPQLREQQFLARQLRRGFQ